MERDADTIRNTVKTWRMLSIWRIFFVDDTVDRFLSDADHNREWIGFRTDLSRLVELITRSFRRLFVRN